MAEEIPKDKSANPDTKNIGVFQQLLQVVKNIPGLPQLIVLSGIALSIAIGIALALWAQKPDYKVLYMGLDQSAKAQVVQSLEKMQIEYQINQYSGDVLIPQNQIHFVKMQLASEGIQTDTTGLEVIHEEQAVGVSQFIEGKRYHHALEAELARTIGALHAVSKARVHLAVPKRSSFIRKNAVASASVLLHLFPGRELTNQQVKAIEELVASSISGLKASSVRVVDQKGNLLSSQDDLLSQSNRHFEYLHKLEQKYVERIQTLLAPIVGYENISAQVSIDMDFDHHEETKEEYDPQSQTVRSEKSHTKPHLRSGGVGGVPGSIANQPVTAENANQRKVTTGGAESSGISAQVHRNYEIDKKLVYRQKSAGEILRISAAVIINQPKMDLDSGEKNQDPNAGDDPKIKGLIQNKNLQSTSGLSDEHIQRLVKDAIGFNQARGDSVTVMTSFFQPVDELEMSEPSFMESLLASHWVLTSLKYFIVAILLLLLIFKVIRPTLQSMLENFQSKPELESVSEVKDDFQDKPELSYEEKLAAIRQRISKDPMTTAQVMKSWMNDASQTGAKG